MANETSGAVQRVQDAQARTEELRAQLSRLARKLSAAYEEAARQNDLLADSRRPPVQFDHGVSAKSWRALAETASLTAQAWEESATPAAESGPRCPRCGEPMVREVVVVLAVGIGVVGVKNIQSIQANGRQMYEHMTVPIGQMAEVATSFQRVRVNLREIILLTSAQEISDCEAKIAERQAEIN